jgi:hypothetical protein
VGCMTDGGMPLPESFNELLERWGISASEVRLLRHGNKDNAAGRYLFNLWQSDLPGLEFYQSLQRHMDRAKLDPSRFWASFVVTPAGETLFVGLYSKLGRKSYEHAFSSRTSQDVYGAGDLDQYELVRLPESDRYSGRLIVEWGEGYRSWLQIAGNQNKRIIGFNTGR